MSARTEITTDSSGKHNSENGSNGSNLHNSENGSNGSNLHNSENGSDVSTLHDFCQPEPLLFAACDDSLTHPTAEFDERFIKGRDAGFSVDIVKDYVATLTDKIRPATIERPKKKSVIFQSGTGQ